MSEPVTKTINGERARPVAVRVRSVSADNESKMATLVAGSLLVGTASTNDFVVADSTASRQHAMLELVSGGVRVKDLGSRNGTWYLGTRIRDAMVPTESTLRIGKTLIYIEPLEANDPAEAALETAAASASGFVAESADMRRVVRLAKKLGATPIAVLFTGEAGVGKEVAARLVYAQDSTAIGPLVVVDCAALSGEQFEQSLRGCRAGAFAEAMVDQPGRLESANGGAVYFKNVDALSLESQAKLIQCLESSTVARLGESTPRPCVFRCFSSAQSDLEQLVQEKRFRSDLYFRLAGSVVDLSPLRNRPEDVGPLVRHFEKQYSTAVPDATLDAWSKWSWPGNVRELENAVRRFALGLDAQIPQPLDGAQKHAHLADAEKAYVLKMLRQCGGKVSAAAQAAGISRSQFYRLMAKFDIQNN
jgi:DNA-binding NtrC family response regulator